MKYQLNKYHVAMFSKYNLLVSGRVCGMRQHHLQPFLDATESENFIDDL